MASFLLYVGKGANVAAENSDRIKGFDGLRAVAVLLVFLHHKTGLNQYDFGGYGVWLFFVLSGFLIVKILHRQRLEIESGKETVRFALAKFMGRRTLRIFPIYYFVLFATIPMFLHGHTDGGRRFLPWEDALNFLYLSNVWIGSICHDLVGPFSHLWTLSIEEQFYLFGSVAILALPSKWAAPFCAAICAVGLVTKWVSQSIGVDAIGLYTNSLINYAFIAYGGLWALSLKSTKPSWGRSKLMGPALLAAYILIPLLLRAIGVGPTDRTFSQYAPVLIGPLLVNILRNQDQILVSFLEIAPIKYLGKISYGFYLYHNFINRDGLEKLGRMMLRHDVHISAIAAAPLLFLITLGVSATSWRFIERPILKLKSRIGGRPVGAIVVAAG